MAEDSIFLSLLGELRNLIYEYYAPLHSPKKVGFVDHRLIILRNLPPARGNSQLRNKFTSFVDGFRADT